jgi:predicted RNA binding protein YcfA (HicA-like mRNA interferase family)
MSGFPVQLRWSQFVGVLRKLGYKPVKSHQGSGRVLLNPTRTPNLILFHEPNPGDTLHKGTLHDSLRKLQLSPDEFVRLLKGR